MEHYTESNMYNILFLLPWFFPNLRKRNYICGLFSQIKVMLCEKNEHKFDNT